MDTEIGTASALKMSYAGITKGCTALGAAMLLAASRAGVSEALLAELGASQLTILARLEKAIPEMLPKAHRWAPEMAEIADFIGETRSEAGVYQALSRFYRQLAQGPDREWLDAVFGSG
jgi:putative dehydrogenase